jgi:DNA-binding cell septation regulator SpoVG
MTKHILFFIHGMGESYSENQYDVLWTGIAKAYCEQCQVPLDIFNNQFERVFINWQSVTSDAEITIFDAAFPQLEVTQKNLPFSDVMHPIRAIRKFITFFMGDVAAYVSENDNNIRSTVWQQMEPYVSKGLPYSIIAHSLGSIIVFDYLFNLFEENHLFLPESEGVEHQSELSLNKISQLGVNFRHLFTLGSPIGLFLLRKGDLWKDGKKFNSIKNPINDDIEKGIKRTWLNFYDEQDVIAYPLENLFSLNTTRPKGPIKDILVNTGWFAVDSHTRYWENQQVAVEISQVLLRDA